MAERQTLQSLMAQSLIELAGTKAIEKITVNDIVNNCQVSRGAFYKYFRDKYDVIEWICKTRYSEIVDEYSHESLEISCAEMFRYILQNISFYKSLSAKRNVEVSDILFDVTFDVMTNFLIKNNSLKCLTDEELFMFRCYNHGLVRMTIEWINDPKRCSPEKIAELTIRSWPLGLSKYLNVQENSFSVIL